MKQKLNDPKSAYEYFASKLAFSASPCEIKQYQEQNEKFNLIDLRKKEDYAKGHIPGATNLPEEDWRSFKGLSKDCNNVLYSYDQFDHLAKKAAQNFAESGYPVLELEGGYQAWKNSDNAIEGNGGNYSNAGNSGGSDYKKSA